MCSKPNENAIERSIEEISKEAIQIREEGGREPRIRKTSANGKIIFSVAAVKIEEEGKDGLKTHIQIATMDSETTKKEIAEKIKKAIKGSPCLSKMITHFINN